MDTIFIQQLKVETIIGVYEQERTIKQPILIDLEILYDAKQARATDNLKYALDYHQLTLDLVDFVGGSSFHLIETLGHEIVDKVYSNKLVESVKLTLYKPQALEQANNVGIKINKGICV